jgi:hypothetical protein
MAVLRWRPTLGWLILMMLGLGCVGAGRDAHDVASDLEGTVTPAMVERLVRNTDLQQVALSISVGRWVNEHFDREDQPRLESFLRDAADALAGNRVRVTQQVVEDSGPNSQQLTLTVALEQSGQTRYIPVVLDLVRDGKRVVISRVRVMTTAGS